MENTGDTSTLIINTINTIFGNLFSSIDNNLYGVIDDLIFTNSNILSDKYFGKIFGTSTTNGILLVANSLLIGIILYYSIRFLMSGFTYLKIETPTQFIFKCIIFGICMNSSFFIMEQCVSLNNNICSIIRGIGEDLFNKNICFSSLINEINNNLIVSDSQINVFTLDGLIQGTLNFSLINLVFSYSLRYVMIKIFVLISPFAFLTLMTESTAHFFRSWFRSLFSLLIIQIYVAIILLLLFSMDYSQGNLLNKFIYIGGIYSLIRANSTVRELFGGISTSVQTGINKLQIGK